MAAVLRANRTLVSCTDGWKGWMGDRQRGLRAMKTSNVWAPILPHPPVVNLGPDPRALYFCAEDGVESGPVSRATLGNANAFFGGRFLPSLRPPPFVPPHEGEGDDEHKRYGRPKPSTLTDCHPGLDPGPSLRWCRTRRTCCWMQMVKPQDGSRPAPG